MRPTRSRALNFLAAGAVALAVTACGGGESTTDNAAGSAASAATTATTLAGPVEVTISNFKFEPVSVTVSVGQKLNFVNKDAQGHTATSDNPGAFDSQSIAAGASTPVTLTSPGTYTYHCSFHPFMKGTVVVR